jgi:hypothetical protein
MREYEPEEHDEIPEEYLEEEFIEDVVEDMEVPEVYWEEDIRNIEDPEIKQKEIEAANEILEKERDLEARLRSGEITESQFAAEYETSLRKKKSSAATRCGLASVGITYEDIGDVAEDYDNILYPHNDLSEKRERIGDVIDEIGEEAAEQLADRMLEDEKISDRAHGIIKRQIELKRK